MICGAGIDHRVPPGDRCSVGSGSVGGDMLADGVVGAIGAVVSGVFVDMFMVGESK